MKSIGILTFNFAQSYGALCQAYALRMALEKLTGTQVGFVNYRPAGFCYSRPLWRPVKRRRIDCFADFRRKYLPAVGKECRMLQELSGQLPLTDIFVGSDQVWNPGLPGPGKDFSYFLPGLFPGVAKHAYAASFGLYTSEQALGDADKIAPGLAGFDHISVREHSGIELCRQLGRSDAVEVLDPTFLLSEEDYNPVSAVGLPSRPVAFLLKETKAHSCGFDTMSRELDSGKTVILNSKKSFSFKYDRHPVTTVEEFLGYLRNAAFVYTDSFHGVALSIIFRRPFALVPNPSAPAGLERMKNLLNLTGLSDRILAYGSAEELRELIRRPIDYSGVVERLEPLRRKAFAYLRSCLQKP